MVKTRLEFIKTLGLAMTGLLLKNPVKESGNLFQSGLPDLLVDKSGNTVTTVDEWKAVRVSIAERWNAYLGVMPPDPHSPAVRILNEEHLEGMVRQYIEYEDEPGNKANAFLIKPEACMKPLPGVVALHSTSDNKMLYISGAEKGEISPMGYNLAKMGFAVICPQCFLWHDKDGRSYEQQAERFHASHPGSKGMAKMLYDAKRAVDVLISLDCVDRDRIGAMGHSLGAKEAFYLGAFDDRVKVIVSNEGGIGIDFSNWDDSWYLGKEIRNFRHQHHELLALCAPKPFLLIGGEFADGSKSQPYIDAVKPVYRMYGAEENIRLFNHGQGHDITPEAERLSYQWITDHLLIGEKFNDML